MLLHVFITKLMPNLKKAKPVFIYRKKRSVIFQLDYSFKLADRNIEVLKLHWIIKKCLSMKMLRTKLSQKVRSKKRVRMILFSQ